MFFDPSKQVNWFVFVRRHGHQVSDFITYNAVSYLDMLHVTLEK